VGKAWLREWPADRRPDAVVDVDPRKFGQRIHGVPVIAPQELPAPGDGPVLCAVGAPGARRQIRAYLETRLYDEPGEFLFLA
jgi:hypothetical protein